MEEFWREFLIGLAALILGVWLTLSNQQVIFTGLIVFGLLSVIVSFVHLAQSRNKKDAAGNTVRNIYPKDRPQEKERFLQTLNMEEDLPAPKEVSISCSRKDQGGYVYLNGENVGLMTPDSPVSFFVTKRNNVVNISEQYEGICFFHVTDAEGIGQLYVGMGVETPAVKIEPDTGLEKGILEIPRPVPDPEGSDGTVGEESDAGPENTAADSESDTVTGDGTSDYITKKGKCELCDKEDADVVECMIEDNLGTRYREICPDCMKKYRATPVKK
jgi:hypothetical protein